MTVVANILFIIMQVILGKRFNLRESIIQLIIALLFGLFMDLTLFLVQLLPMPETLVMRSIFLIISLFIVSVGLLSYFTSKFPVMPYDELPFIISEKFNMEFSKAKITCDLINVVIAGSVCVIFIQSLGSIGIGTIVSAYFIGKILGWLMKNYQEHLVKWVNPDKDDISRKSIDNATL